MCLDHTVKDYFMIIDKECLDTQFCEHLSSWDLTEELDKVYEGNSQSVGLKYFPG